MTHPGKESLLTFSAVVAYDARSRLIGTDNHLPWKPITEDMQQFRKLTIGDKTKPSLNIVVMGRKTWESLPKKSRPLQGRINVVLSKTTVKKEKSDGEEREGARWFHSWDHFERYFSQGHVRDTWDQCFVIGGQTLYTFCLSGKRRFCCENLYVTEIFRKERERGNSVSDLDDSNDQVNMKKEKEKVQVQIQVQVQVQGQIQVRKAYFLPLVDLERDPCFELCWMTEIQSSSPSISYRFLKYKVIQPETQYISLLEKALMSPLKPNRTNVPTRSINGAQLYFDFEWGFPLLTTKRVFWRGVVKELLWFLSGKTDAKLLSRDKVYIWDKNASRSFLDSVGLKDHPEGDLGPIYGFQWRHWGATYSGANRTYSQKEGIDQVARIEEMLKRDPYSRRILLSAWNVSDLHQMALPPCHVIYQFYLYREKVWCSMFMRSSDLFLGLPFNIASTALLTYMMAAVTGHEPGGIILSMTDVHLYNTHCKQAAEQISRSPRGFPDLKLKRVPKHVWEFKENDFELVGWNPMNHIRAEMVA